MMPTSEDLNRPVRSRSSPLDVIRINTRSRFCGNLTKAALVTSIEVDILEVEGVDVAWEISIRDGKHYQGRLGKEQLHTPAESDRCSQRDRRHSQQS